MREPRVEAQKVHSVSWMICARSKTKGMDFSMSRLFDSIKQGLTEAVEYERGKLQGVKVDKVMVAPIHTYTPVEIRQIRTTQGMTQRIFAEALGVSVKTIESWEAGTNKPSGMANRMLELIQQDAGLFERLSIVARQTPTVLSHPHASQ